MVETIALSKPMHGNVAATRAAVTGKVRVLMLQTQAEAAGAQEISRILGLGLLSKGFDIHHVFFFRRTSAFDAQPNTFFCSRERPRSPVAVVRMFISLVRHLRAVKPDAVVCFQHYGNVVGVLAAKLAGVKAVIINRNSDRSLVPAWVRGLELTFGLCGLFQRLVVNSASVEKEYAHYPAAYRSRLARIDHGFETKTTALGSGPARDLLSLPRDLTLLGSVGRLHPTKNLQAAIRLLVGRDWHLALAGQGPARQDLVDLAASCGVRDRLHLVGELSPGRIADFLGALDVFVFPSSAETFGLAAVEAAQSGVPVVANDLEVLREVLAIEQQPCAVLVDVEDTAAFARAVERIVGDAAFRTDLTSRARKLSERFSMDAMVGGYADLIQDAVAGRTPSATRQQES
jgi:glycosyltransferase involved in cell wall biosynthesis